jgi:hypothetical protein
VQTIPHINVIPAAAGTHLSAKFDIEEVAPWVPTVVGMTGVGVGKERTA